MTTSTRDIGDTRVTRLSASAYRIPTDRPEADGTYAWNATTLVRVEVAGGGEVGLGWTYAPAATGEVISGFLADVVLGTDLLDVGGTNQAMIRAGRNAGRPGLVGEAISGVDTALWDLKGKVVGLPVHRLIGACRDSVPLYGSGGFTTYSDDRLSQQVEEWLAVGMTAGKIKIGEDRGRRVDRDILRMRQAKALLGPDRELFVDANGGYTRKQAIRVMERVGDLDVAWFEEPVSSDDPAGLREVRDAVSADVAAGEYGYDLVYFRRLCEEGAVDCLQADVSRCGGITEWLRVAAVAAAFGLEISGHCAPHLHAHVAAAVPNLRHLEWFHDHVRIEAAALDAAAAVQDGRLVLGDEPGLGIRWREADMAEFRVG
ncbi:enolase C-terminal domain-like protein [Raineyella fluvialis]|uniref:Mandelate racemase n=1 Tax=Raineyella fluvialis TaxID=2662261 RepID=A0A5Q2F7G7_9ACTN|nr:enolase C-terminal domain-like protein [Raineyella fluvialis]QGF22779.1 mandelate racemase [Raineyella fluvialis]